MTVPNDASSLRREVVRLITEHWKSWQEPLLLSRLGEYHSGAIGEQAKRSSDGLKAYLNDQLADQIRVIQHSTKHAMIGALPKDVPVDNESDFDMLLERSGRTTSSQEASVPRFRPAFWAAFSKPLLESYQRYLFVEEPIHFKDLSQTSDPPADSVKIEQKFIVDPGGEPTEIYEKITDWLSNHELEQSRFFWKPRDGDRQLPAKDLLSSLLLALRPEELKRISMPLDVINTLRRTPL